MVSCQTELKESIVLLCHQRITGLAERAAGPAAAWVWVRPGATEHGPDVVRRVGVAEVVVVVVVVDALPVLPLPPPVPSQAPQFLLPQWPQRLRRLVRQVALASGTRISFSRVSYANQFIQNLKLRLQAKVNGFDRTILTVLMKKRRSELVFL